MAAPPAIDPREGLRPLFERAGIDDNFYHRYKERLLDKGVDQVAGGAAVRTPAEAAVERAGVRTGRGGGRRARRQAGRLLAQVRMGETAARVASARADGGIGRGAESIAALGRVRGGRGGPGRGGALGRVRGGVGWGGCRRRGIRTPALVARTMASKEAVVCALSVV